MNSMIENILVSIKIYDNNVIDDYIINVEIYRGWDIIDFDMWVGILTARYVSENFEYSEFDIHPLS